MIFAAWEDMTEGLRATILEESWRENYLGSVANGYDPAVRHIGLVENEGYQLFIFRARKEPDLTENGAVKMKEFEQELIQARVHREGDAWIATFMHAPWNHQDAAPALRVSVGALQKCLEAFRKHVRQADGRRFESFSKGIAGEQEGYKADLASIAKRQLVFNEWDIDKVGDGQIWDRVVSAIKIKKNASTNTPENNLIYWQRHGLPGGLEDLKNQPDKLFRVESLLFDLFTDELEVAEAFDELVNEIGRLYALMAYLFFIKDPDRFLPIAPQTFDTFFQSIGVDLQTEHRCSWENYSRYLDVISQVRDFLRKEQNDNISLLDAHSFCWMVAGLDTNAESTSPVLPTLRRPALPDTQPDRTSGGNEPDWVALHRARVLLGAEGEEVALEAEKHRLREEGHYDLAEKVCLVSGDHTYGFDIFSYEKDGSPRLIEVKTSRSVDDTVNFSTSHRQWERAHSGANYYYYFVHLPKGGKPTVTMVKGSEIPLAAAVPVVYSINLTLHEASQNRS